MGLHTHVGNTGFILLQAVSCFWHGQERITFDLTPRVADDHTPGFKHLQLMLGRLKQPDELQDVFQAAGVDLTQPLLTSCGSGVTASVLALALAQLSPQPKVRLRQQHPNLAMTGSSISAIMVSIMLELLRVLPGVYCILPA